MRVCHKPCNSLANGSVRGMKGWQMRRCSWLTLTHQSHVRRWGILLVLWNMCCRHKQHQRDEALRGDWKHLRELISRQSWVSCAAHCRRLPANQSTPRENNPVYDVLLLVLSFPIPALCCFHLKLCHASNPPAVKHLELRVFHEEFLWLFILIHPLRPQAPSKKALYDLRLVWKLPP